MIKISTTRKDSGQFLIELLVALTMSVMIIVAVVGLSTLSVRTSYRARQNTEAKRLAEEVLEWLRSEKKKNWYEFYKKAGSDDSNIDYCLNNLEWSFVGSCSSPMTDRVYKREVKLFGFLDGNEQKVQAVVVVSWNDNQGNHNVTAETIFTDEE